MNVNTVGFSASQIKKLILDAKGKGNDGNEKVY